MVRQLDDDLGLERDEILEYAKENDQLLKAVNSEDEFTSYQKTADDGKAKFYTEYQTNTVEKDNFRILKFYTVVKGENYEVKVAKSLENTERIIKLVILITSITILVLMLASFFVNRIVLRKLWQPFDDTMFKVKDYRLGQTDLPVFQKTNINEFQTLNDTLEESIQRNKSDFNILQTFTENASHEMQTPLAIIHSKIDSLIQDENLSASQSNMAQEAYTALQRLSKLNKTLLLLTKIDNKQFTATETIDFKKILEEKILHFHDLIEKKKLSLTFVHSANPTIQMNSGLADIMLNNLFNNCIKYTKQNGKIDINVQNDFIEFCNGPSDIPLEGSRIFDRFYKSGNLPDQHGLGLAIVKEICNASNFQIKYLHRQQQHVIRIEFAQ